MNTSAKLLFSFLILLSTNAIAQKGLYSYVGIKKNLVTNNANTSTDGGSRYSTGTNINPSLELSYRANLYQNKLFLQLGGKAYRNALFLKYRYSKLEFEYDMKANTSFNVLEFPIGLGVQLPKNFQFYLNYSYGLNYNAGWGLSSRATNLTNFNNNSIVSDYKNYNAQIASASIIKDYKNWSAKLTGTYAFQKFGLVLQHNVSSSLFNLNEVKSANTAPLFVNLNIGYKLWSRSTINNRRTRRESKNCGCPKML
jgi:hypothetical protein